MSAVDSQSNLALLQSLLFHLASCVDRAVQDVDDKQASTPADWGGGNRV